MGSAIEDAWTVLKMSQPKMGQPAVDTALKQNVFEGGIEGIFPVAGVILPDRAVRFEWRGERLKGEKPALFFFKEGTNHHQVFPVSADAKEMTVGVGHFLPEWRYRWYVGRVEKGKPIAQSRVYSFAILAQAESEAMKNDLLQLEKRSLKTEGADFLKAQIFYHYRLYHEMVGVLRPLHQKFKSAAVQRLLFLGYVKLGKLNEAEKFRSKN